MKRALTVLFLCAACGPPVDPPNPPGKTKLDLNDVSYLYPLPATIAGRDSMLKFTSAGAKGGLLTRAFFDQVKAVEENVDKTIIYDGMRIVSARVDHCFPVNKKDEPLKCVKQVRLVAQIVQEKDGGVTTGDGTIHLFYDQTDAEWEKVLEGVGALKDLAKTATDGKPLDIHPVMKVEGLNGPYAKKLNELILAQCGEQNLSRLAFMISSTDGNDWTFGAFNRKGTLLEADPIPRFVDKNEQQITEHGVEERRSSEMIPSPSNIDLTTILSYTEIQLADDLSLARATKEALLIENPDKETPQTIDCASCHLASRAVSFAAKTRNIDLSSFADRYVAPARFDVRRVDEVENDPFAQRAFGYFHAKSALSQRTINESAQIADVLSPK